MPTGERRPLPAVDEVLARATVFALPMTREFRGIWVREGMVIDGPSGWGEWAPFPEYDDHVASTWLAAALESAFGEWPEPVRDSVPVNAIIPGVSPDDAYALASVAIRDGCDTVKVKVGAPGAGASTVPQDVERVAAVRAALDDADVAGLIRVDANAVWSVDDAVAALVLLDAAARGLDYAEQPCATLDELVQVRQRTGVRIAADESIRTASDPARAASSGAADVVVVKVAPLGGVARALEVVRAAGVPCIVSGAMDSSVGLAAGVALAAALPHLDGACGLGTGSLLAADLLPSPLVPRGGALTVGRVVPDAECLARAAHRVTSERQLWWRDRLARAYALHSAVHKSPRNHGEH